MIVAASWLLAIGGIIVLWMTGHGYRTGWLAGALLQIPWAAYAIYTHQYGFLLECGAYFYLFTRTYKRLSLLDAEAQSQLLEGEHD